MSQKPISHPEYFPEKVFSAAIIFQGHTSSIYLSVLYCSRWEDNAYKWGVNSTGKDINLFYYIIKRSMELTDHGDGDCERPHIFVQIVYLVEGERVVSFSAHRWSKIRATPHLGVWQTLIPFLSHLLTPLILCILNLPAGNSAAPFLTHLTSYTFNFSQLALLTMRQVQSVI